MTAPGAKTHPSELREALKEALRNKASGYQPRTRHLDPRGAPHFTNRLILEASPYLLQHAHNPVDWHPWGEDAFEAARARGVPVLLSVGYSTCHWCHVMEHESFEDLEVAEVMNSRYVCIKVDREVLPDVDSVYMSAVQALTGRGGWPMTVWLTPDRLPFYGGTYFPPRSGMRGMGIGFLSLLNQLGDIYATQPEKIQSSSAELTDAIRNQLQAPPPGELGTWETLRSAWADIYRTFDARNGGFGSAPKFPMGPTLAFGLSISQYLQDPQASEAVLLTLRKMAEGGIYDHLGGGFHRYSTDNRWLAPHFEKMLYDQGMLVPLYLSAFQLSGDPLFAKVARETLDYVIREMGSSSGAFFAATDADSEGEEGTFFVWSPEAVSEVLPQEQAEAVMAYYDVTPGGNWEGKSILNTPRSLQEVAEGLGTPREVLKKRLGDAKATLYQARLRREAPHLDDKVITAWSAMMVDAFARGARVLGEERYLEVAREAAEALLSPSPRRRILGGGGVAYLDDLAFLTGACLSLFEATGEGRWLEEAIKLAEEIEADYKDPEGQAYFLAPTTADALLVREKPYQDGVLPSGNAKHADNCLRLYGLTDGLQYLERAEGILKMGALYIEKAPRAVAAMADALGRYLSGPKLALIIEGGEGGGEALMEALRGRYLPGVGVLCLDEAQARALEGRVPQLKKKTSQGGQARGYICLGGSCLAPASKVEDLSAALEGILRGGG